MSGDLISKTKLMEDIRNTITEMSGTMDWLNLINGQTVVKDNGWIPCSKRLPKTNDAVNITWINRSPAPYYADIKDKEFTATGHYCNGRWYWHSCVSKDFLDEYGDSYGDRVDEDIEVIAWQPLPEPYKEVER